MLLVCGPLALDLTRQLELFTREYVFACLFPFMFPIKVSSFSFKAMLVLDHASRGLHDLLILGSCFWVCLGPSQGQDRVLCIFGVYMGHGQVQGRHWATSHQLSQLERSRPVLEPGELLSWPCGCLLAYAALGRHSDEMRRDAHSQANSIPSRAASLSSS